MPGSPIVFNAPDNTILADAIGRATGGIARSYDLKRQNALEGTHVQQAFDEIAQNPLATTPDIIKAIFGLKSKGVSQSTIEHLAETYPKILKEQTKAKQISQDEQLWKDVVNRRSGGNSSASAMAPQNTEQQPSQGGLSQENYSSQDLQQETKIKPKYASDNVDPQFFKKDIAKYEATRLAEADKGFKRNEKYLTTLQEQAGQQPFIQDALRGAINDVRSGKTSGASAAIRNKMGNLFPSIKSVEEKDFDNAMKTVALEQFASTPGFRSQGEFFILKDVLPKLGDRQKAQELMLKSILDSSIMREMEEKVALEIINQSPDNEVPLNLRDVVKERMDNEWKKLYARRYAEDPQIWDKYIESSSGKNDPLFKDIKNIAVPSSSIDWSKYKVLIDDKGRKKAVPNDQVQQKISEGYKEF